MGCRQSQWPCGLRGAACLPGLRVRILLEAWMLICYECHMWSEYLRLADDSSRVVLPSVVCLGVLVRPR